SVTRPLINGLNTHTYRHTHTHTHTHTCDVMLIELSGNAWHSAWQASGSSSERERESGSDGFDPLRRSQRVWLPVTSVCVEGPVPALAALGKWGLRWRSDE